MPSATNASEAERSNSHTLASETPLGAIFIVNRPQPARERRLSSTFGLSLLAIVLAILMPLPYLALPLQDAPQDVDVIMVMGPPDQDRLDLATDLISKGYSQNLVISAKSTGKTHNLNNMPICQSEQDFYVVCATPSPFTTQGEIGLLEQLSQENGWNSAVVITFKPHLARTRLYAARCYSGDALFMAPERKFGLRQIAFQYAYQISATAKALTITPGCSRDVL